MGDSKRKLTVTACEERHRGTDKNDREYVIYEVFAVDEHDAVVDEPLRSFEQLAIGEQREYDVKPFDHPKHGRTYTLSPAGKSSGQRLGPKVDELREKVEALEAQVEILVDKVERLESPGSAPVPEQDIPF